MRVATAALYYFHNLCASHTGNNQQFVGTTAIMKKVSDKYLPIRYDDYSWLVMKTTLVRYPTDELLLGRGGGCER